MPTSKSAKKNLSHRIPRISTRGFYDLGSAKMLKKKPYDLYPKRFFKSLGNFPEFTIMIHGLRNNEVGALAKFRIAQRRLRQLGYKHPVVGFSYDSNTRGVQYKSRVIAATNTGRIIARKNGNNLAKFITDFKKQNPTTRIRLMGHSLGTEVILHTLCKLKHKKKIIETVYFFGSSIPANFISTQKFGKILQNTVAQKIINYYSLNDDVLRFAFENKIIQKPLGYCGAKGKIVTKYLQKRTAPKNHRFASYAAILKSFP
jgi:hypothetical protein